MPKDTFTPLLPAFLVAAVIGCAVDTTKNDRPVRADSALIARAKPAPSDTAQSPASWKFSLAGIGPLRAGMSLEEVQNLVSGLSAETSVASEECTYARSSSLPAGAVLMFVNGALARVDVLSGRLRTDAGGGIGDSEDQIKLLYGNSVATSPHKYTDGHYLTVSPATVTDSAFRLVFETDGSKVIRYRAGRLPEVEWVEGCA